ncbi:MAG TPA: NAD(P)H-quinone oxidoreductase [Pseudomonadales bacterium]|nr:NAD(P)H-quinone oxidoreductase [Gammaproteobacteria bacterium]HIM34113.1 NAD(P)H-quinone oxidoreductase [Pseudomonadales bacterium]
MKAIQVDGQELRWNDVVEPPLGVGEVRIANRATALNRADLAQRAGHYAPPPDASLILGLECAGVVEAVGEGVGRVREGDHVCALLAGGGYAEKVVVPAGQVLPIPEGLSFHEAAALPEVFATAYLNLFMEAYLEPGEFVLLHAGASGVGTAAIQLCGAFDNPCFVTAGNTEKVERCVELGAAAGCDRHVVNFVEEVPRWTSQHGMDVILDPVGGAYFESNIASLAVDGRLVLIGLLDGSTAPVALGAMMSRRLRVIGSTLRGRSIAAKSRVMDALRERVWPLIEAGKIRAIVETVMPVTDANQAHQLLSENGTFGKVVLDIP